MNGSAFGPRIPISRVLGVLVIPLGLIPAFWGGIEGGDSVRYLNMSRALAAGHWTGVINGLWSPLYPILHGFALFIFHRSWKQELSVVNLINFMIYAFSIICFWFFWQQVLVLYKRNCGHPSSDSADAILSDRSFWALGYSIFLFSHLPLISSGTPDLLLAAIVNLAGGILLRIKFAGGHWLWFAALGGTLGLGYLTKAVLLPLSLVFLACAILGGALDRRKLAGALIACGMFLAVSSPFIWALSKKEGHFTIGDSGRLNYAWHVNRIPDLNWQGQPPGFGFPLHPTIRILDLPEAYEFPGSQGEIYPPFDNAPYWNDGLKPRFSFSDQIRSWKRNALECLKSLWSQSPLLVGVLIILGMVRSSSEALKQFARTWYLWVPVLAIVLLYVTIHWEERYISPFMAMGWAPLICLIRLPGHQYSRRLLKAFVIVVVAIMMLVTVTVTMRDALHDHRTTKQNFEIAEGLRAAGLEPNEKIAEVNAYVAIWEWLTRVSVVAEISDEYPRGFWPASREKQTQIYERLAATGARALISSSVPPWASDSDWQEIGNTPMYIHYLDRR
jgi:hypothetical protein